MDRHALNHLSEFNGAFHPRFDDHRVRGDGDGTLTGEMSREIAMQRPSAEE